jgi:hypothetical protein
MHIVRICNVIQVYLEEKFDLNLVQSDRSWKQSCLPSKDTVGLLQLKEIWLKHSCVSCESIL